MFLNDSIQRKLGTLLRPWLRGDSELELKLGFLRSNATLNNVSFDTSALNELLDDPSKFCFKEATVEHLTLKFAPFSSAAFTLVVRGLSIRLSLGYAFHLSSCFDFFVNFIGFLIFLSSLEKGRGG